MINIHWAYAILAALVWYALIVWALCLAEKYGG
jgi:hypothetical protein